MTEREGPIENRFRATMSALAAGIDKILNGDKRPRENGFVLLTFRFGETDGGRINYISNGERADIVTALKEILARFEGRYHDGDTKQ